MRLGASHLETEKFAPDLKETKRDRVSEALLAIQQRFTPSSRRDPEHAESTDERRTEIVPTRSTDHIEDHNKP